MSMRRGAEDASSVALQPRADMRAGAPRRSGTGSKRGLARAACNDRACAGFLAFD